MPREDQQAAGLLISIEPLIDMGRTAVNVSGAMTAGAVTSRLLGQTVPEPASDGGPAPVADGAPVPIGSRPAADHALSPIG